MVKQYLTKTEIARQADVSIGRCKYAMNQFSEYFTAHKIDGNAYPCYELEAVQVVKIITDMIANGDDHTTIRQKLDDSGYSQVYDVVKPKATTKAIDGYTAIEENKQLLINNRDMQHALDTISALRQLNEHQAQIIDDQKRIIQDLKQNRDNIE